jgi:hypothetical protein
VTLNNEKIMRNLVNACNVKVLHGNMIIFKPNRFKENSFVHNIDYNSCGFLKVDLDSEERALWCM